MADETRVRRRKMPVAKKYFALFTGDDRWEINSNASPVMSG
jgi:hypothetical protein